MIANAGWAGGPTKLEPRVSIPPPVIHSDRAQLRSMPPLLSYDTDSSNVVTVFGATSDVVPVVADGPDDRC